MSVTLASFLLDHQRLASRDQASFLYAAFPVSRDVSPVAWDSRLDFWTAVLDDALRNAWLTAPSSRLAVDAASLSQQLQRNGVVPLGLSRVLAELVQAKKLVSVDELGKGHADWLLDWLVKTPVKWLLSKLQIYSPAGSNGITQGLFVYMPLLKETSARIMQSAKVKCFNHASCIMTLAEFKHTFDLGAWNPNDIDFLMIDLEKNGAMITDYVNGEQIIKFLANHQQNTITSLDLHILKVKHVLNRLEAQINDANSKILLLNDAAKQYIQQKSTVQAKGCLKRRKLLQDVLQKRTAALDTLTGVMLRIEMSESDAEVLEAYSAGTTALKTIAKADNMTVERVEETMDALSDILADQREIDQAFNEGINQVQVSTTGIEFDMKSLENELDQLISETNIPSSTLPQQSSDMDVTQQLNDLQVPSHQLLSSQKSTISNSQKQSIKEPM